MIETPYFGSGTIKDYIFSMVDTLEQDRVNRGLGLWEFERLTGLKKDAWRHQKDHSREPMANRFFTVCKALDFGVVVTKSDTKERVLFDDCSEGVYLKLFRFIDADRKEWGIAIKKLESMAGIAKDNYNRSLHGVHGCKLEKIVRLLYTLGYEFCIIQISCNDE